MRPWQASSICSGASKLAAREGNPGSSSVMRAAPCSASQPRRRRRSARARAQRRSRCAQDFAYLPRRLPRFSDRLERQREGEGRALSNLAHHPDLSTVKFDELAGDGEAEASAFGFLRSGTDLPEFLEDSLLIFESDAYTGVGDGDLGNAIANISTHIDSPTFGGELERVGKEVQEHLLHLPLIGVNCPQTFPDIA